MTNYQVGDFLIRIKNAALAQMHEVEVKNTKMVESIANVLKREGFLEDVSIKDGKLSATLSYRKKKPLIMDIKLISKPGLRVYMGVTEMAHRKAASILILSTSKGIFSNKEALKKGVGGEVVAEVW
jgi:small subunit ribosomal protein S8